MFSGVQERLQERIGPVRAWLFPRRVYLQLEDQAITAMALDGRRIVWLERVPLPPGLCENGEAVRVDSLADLLGDLLVERGFLGARIDAVLAPPTCQMRLVQWPGGRWPDDPERSLALNEEELGLKSALQYLDLHLIDLQPQRPTSLLVTVPGAVLDRWIEVFSQAGASLERIEAFKLCVCRGLAPLIGPGSTAVVLQLEPGRSGLMILENGVPSYERRLPGAERLDAVREDLQRTLQYWRELRPDSMTASPLLLVHGTASDDPARIEALATAVGCPWQSLDPLAQGWLKDDSAEVGARPDGAALAALWGLAATEVLA